MIEEDSFLAKRRKFAQILEVLHEQILCLRAMDDPHFVYILDALKLAAHLTMMQRHILDKEKILGTARQKQSS